MTAPAPTGSRPDDRHPDDRRPSSRRPYGLGRFAACQAALCPATAGLAGPRPSGVREVVRYNWPMYAAGALTAAAAGGALARRLPGPAAALARTAAATAAGYLAVSTLATWCVYDRSELHRYDWLPALLPDGPGDHLVVSTGLDEASRPIAERHPTAPRRVADLYDPALTSSGSIRRARRHAPPAPGGIPARPDALPAGTGELDTVFAVFAAHELRRPADRTALFTEAARALRPGGTLLLVEHLRDAANTAVYGPGAWHFLPRATWLRHAAEAGLHPAAERRIAGLVTAFAFRKPEPCPN
ncbi:class I SAM-dependent methyltransferase [Kitasatospora sp. NPDC096204]|uniref:class I SAM-dependent methyltransferase n=1 Tax=Kitasatospora sp. NPDC096204 TaxID=3364094 RepID=UPI00382216A8